MKILRFIRIDDKRTRPRRRENDKYASIRDLWETVMNNVEKRFFPLDEVTIDEQLFPYRSRCGFIQYMPQIPVKFGIKYWLLWDVKTLYVLRSIPYVGKEDRSQIGVAEHKSYHYTGQNFTTDNYVTTLNTAQNLLQHNITMVRTLRKKKREIPLELHADTKQQPLYTSQFLLTTDGIMILYYKAKKKKDAFLLSSMHIAPVVNENEAKKKPEAILYYNSTKGGVDTAGEMLRCYSTKAASRHWPLAAFFNLLDIISLNAFVIAKDIGMMQSYTRSFLISLGDNCVKKSGNDV